MSRHVVLCFCRRTVVAVDCTLHDAHTPPCLATCHDPPPLDTTTLQVETLPCLARAVAPRQCGALPPPFTTGTANQSSTPPIRGTAKRHHVPHSTMPRVLVIVYWGCVCRGYNPTTPTPGPHHGPVQSCMTIYTGSPNLAFRRQIWRPKDRYLNLAVT